MSQDDPADIEPVKEPIQDAEELTHQVLRQANLPTGGSYPFIPPKYWRTHQPLRKNSKGEFIDVRGRRWRKGPTRTEGETWEWDVQLPNGDHLNIDWSGNITHPKPSYPRSKGQRSAGLGGKAKNRRRKNKK